MRGCGHRRRRNGRSRLRPLAGRLSVELRDQPIQAVEVVLQPLLGVVLRVADDADRATVAAVDDCFEQLQIEFALAERQDFAPLCRLLVPCR